MSISKKTLIRYVLEALVFLLLAVAVAHSAPQLTITQTAMVEIISTEDLAKYIVIEPNPITFGIATPGSVVKSELITIKNVGNYTILVDLIHNMTTDLDPSIGYAKATFCNWVSPGETYTTRLILHVSPDCEVRGKVTFHIYIYVNKVKAGG